MSDYVWLLYYDNSGCDPGFEAFATQEDALARARAHASPEAGWRELPSSARADGSGAVWVRQWTDDTDYLSLIRCPWLLG